MDIRVLRSLLMSPCKNLVLVRMDIRPQGLPGCDIHHIYHSDYFDLMLIHDPFGGKEKRLETYHALLDAKKAGKTRTIGVSNLWVVVFILSNMC